MSTYCRFAGLNVQRLLLKNSFSPALDKPSAKLKADYQNHGMQQILVSFHPLEFSIDQLFE